MEECSTCKSCGCQTWIILKDKMRCSKCKKEYSWPMDCTTEEATKAQDLVNLTNDNY